MEERPFQGRVQCGAQEKRASARCRIRELKTVRKIVHETFPGMNRVEHDLLDPSPEGEICQPRTEVRGKV